MTSHSLTAITGATFDEPGLRNDAPVLVEFGAARAGPCLIAPVLEQVARDNRHPLRVTTLDVADRPHTACTSDIFSMPIMTLVRDGLPTTWVVSARPRAAHPQDGRRSTGAATSSWKAVPHGSSALRADGSR